MATDNTAFVTVDRFSEEAFDLLAHEHCRRLFVALAGSDHRAEHGVASDWVVDEIDDSDLLEKGRYYDHLSKLVDLGFVQWDRETDTITRGERFDELSPLFDRLASRRPLSDAEPPTDCSLDEVFDALGHPFGRYVLRFLADPTAHPDRESEHPDCESESSHAFVDDDPDVLERKLRCVHLDTLDDYGFVDWNPQTDTLARGENFEEVAAVLEFVAESQEDDRGNDRIEEFDWISTGTGVEY
ncbi:hypothetical protein SAMN04487948_11261 [Halogranum amylolyticum]|uniref:Uncharacterized protein n=1 Tax=Halogranum amylolyticum TaxID=660520 RepID=A0A1H8UT77_9EURY|nr:hypothetical protein [Halogranum amylolyticum]SEP05778.1 hypothetical protein SAMN04487948_11261 [Halogranum amylolyticum]